jgi:hypothetical protein
MYSAFGVDHGNISKAATVTGTKGDKRNTKYLGAAYGGMAAGGFIGRQIGARSAGTTVTQAKEANLARIRDYLASSKATTAKEFSSGIKAYPKTPGLAATIKGNKIGAAAGALSGVAAYGAYRKNKKAK